jgi:hypothetical protein
MIETQQMPSAQARRLASLLDSAAFHSLDHPTHEGYRDDARHEQLAILGATVGCLALIVGSLALLSHVT